MSRLYLLILCYNLCMTKKILKENYLYLFLLIALILVFSFIMRSSLHDKIIVFDLKVFEILSKHINNILTNIFKVFTFLGDYYIPIAILVCILIFIKNKWYFILQTACYSIAGIITYFSKLLAARPRPMDAMIKMPTTYSFPSGHTLTSIVFYVMLMYILTFKMDKNKRHVLMIIMLFFASFIALSRIYLGVHYFSDVLGGAIIAIILIFMFTNIIRKNYGDKL